MASGQFGLRSFWGIGTLTSTLHYERPWLYPLQERAVFAPERYSVIEASTKSGKTVGCMAWLFEQAAVHGAPGRNYWWVAPTLDVSRIAYRRLKRAIPRELYTANETYVFLSLANGATIWFKGADRPDTLYGEDVYACVVDEATRCKEDAWTAVRSTLSATQGPVRIIGNVKGRHNWAYRLARKAEAGTADMAYFKITAKDALAAGVFPVGELEDAQGVIPETAFRELYYAEPADDGSNPFGFEAITSCAIHGEERRRSECLAIVGGPHTGKTTLAAQFALRGFRIQATDTLIATHEWSDASALAATWLGQPGTVIEGVAVVRAMRKWLTAHPEGRPCDAIIMLEQVYGNLNPGQARMAAGHQTIWEEIAPELTARGVEIHTDPEAAIVRYEHGVETATLGGVPEVWGWDFARAQDWTVGIALDRANQVVRLERWQLVPWEETYRRIVQHQGMALGWGDSTGLGDVVIETLQGRGCPMQPYTFSAKSKQLLMERLASAIQQRAVRFPAGSVLHRELEAFEYTYTATGVRYTAPAGLHDDCVMALALAVYGRDQVGYLADQYEPVDQTPDRHPGLAERYPWIKAQAEGVKVTRPRFRPRMPVGRS